MTKTGATGSAECYIARVLRLIHSLLCLAAVMASLPAAAVDAGIPPPQELEAAGAIIGRITFDRQNVFDLSDPEEDKALYRLANRWHIVTRESVVRNQLLFKEGDAYSKRLAEESERLLRQNAYFYDARVEVVNFQDGVVDIRVWTRDLWTLMPGLSVSRSGGENRTRVSVSERNLLGRGISVRLNYIDNVDRELTSFQYHDRHLGNSWTSLFFEVADASDGHTTDVRLIRPFFELDARWSAGATFLDNASEESYYELGDEAAEYAADVNSFNGFVGLSRGLKDGWVRRWIAGAVYDHRRFAPVTDGTLQALVPADRKLVYPYFGFELLEDRYESTSNRDQIDRTEDFFVGTRLWASLGYSSTGFDGDRDAWIYRAEFSRGFGSMEKKALLFSSTLTGRVDEGRSVNTEFGVSARYYNQISDKRLSFVTFDASKGNRLDLDNLVDLGGDTGLRGYPLRYQTGESRMLLTVEQRYFTDWYPWRLFRVGGAVFADVGRVWGENPLGNEHHGWLKDVGVGLRLAPTRASGRDVIHIDIAFPLDGDPTIDDVQFLVESKRSF